MGRRRCVSTSRNTRHAGLIHRCGKPSWTEVANGYLDLTQWGPPPWSEMQWVTLRNVIELAEDD